jgi:hypothetical protein
MPPNETQKLFAIIESLKQARISHSLYLNRDDAVTVLAVVPGYYWEIDVFKNGDVEVEVFSSDGEILDEIRLAALIAEFSD